MQALLLAELYSVGSLILFIADSIVMRVRINISASADVNANDLAQRKPLSWQKEESA